MPTCTRSKLAVLALFVAFLLAIGCAIGEAVLLWTNARPAGRPVAVEPSAPSIAPLPSTVELPDGRHVTAAPGMGMEVDVTTSKSGGILKEDRQRRVIGAGPGLNTNTEGGAANFNSTPPAIDLGPGEDASSQGGGAMLKQTFLGGSKSSPLMWAGILVALAGVGAIVWGVKDPLKAKLIKPGFLAVLAGAGLCVASTIPETAWYIAGGVILALVVFYLWEAHAHAGTQAKLATSTSFTGKVDRAIKKAGDAGTQVLKQLDIIGTTVPEDLHLADAAAKTGT